MLSSLLKSAARTMWQAQGCASVGRAGTMPQLPSLVSPAQTARLQQLAGQREIVTTASISCMHADTVFRQSHSLQGSATPLSASVSASRRQLTRLIPQAQSADIPYRSYFSGQSHQMSALYFGRQHQHGGSQQSSQQLQAAQNFGIWSGSRSQDDDFARAKQAQQPSIIGIESAAHSPPAPLQLQSAREKKAHRRELHTVNVAIATNFAIFLAKLGVFSFTGSNALFAEAVHSLADVANQALLWVGIKRSKRAPTKLHPYGYMRDKFVFSLISAVGIFCLGAGVSVWHGFSGLMSGAEIEHIWWSFAVLGVSLVLESISLVVAIRSVREGAEAAGLSFMEYVKKGVDPTSVAVMMEDSGAVAGLAIATICTALVHTTGQVMWDSIGSICVGVMMGVTAWFLISRNRQMLIGRSMSPEDMKVIITHLENDPVVEHVYDAKSEEIGPGIFRFKAEIDFLGEEVVQRHMNGAGRADLLRRIQKAAAANDNELDFALKAYGEEIINAVGAEVDRIETEIQGINPGIRYVDLETDRGEASTWPRSRRVVTPGEVGVVW